MKYLFRIFVVCIFAGAAINGSYAAETNLQTAKRAYEKNNVVKAVKLLLPLAKAGDPKARLLLGSIYELTDGTHGVKSDNTKARFWYEQAVKQDYTLAFGDLGRHLIREGRNPKRGFRLLKVAAKRGDAMAQFSLGVYYLSNSS
ncbi:MAG: tetratricopeptide repeat protein [Alphaproteobacteria bacterium]